MNFQDVAEALNHIATTSSTSTKEALLKHFDVKIPGFKDVLKYIYDPYFTTGIGQRKLEVNYCSPVTSVLEPEELMDFLRANSTGGYSPCAAATTFVYSSEDPIWQWAATGLVTKDLQIGVSVTTLNKVFGNGFIPKIGIMRGMHCPDDAEGIYIVTEKIDGNRRLIMNKSTGVEIYTRSGKRDYGLVEIEAQAKSLPVDYVYDCECVAVGDFNDSIELRQASASILNSKGRRKGVKALCFDVLSQAEYDAGMSIHGAVARKTMLASIFGDETSFLYMTEYFRAEKPRVSQALLGMYMSMPHVYLPNITCLPILGIARNKAEAVALAEPIWETGGEGCMMVEYLSPYEVNPNPRKSLLKIKATKEYVLHCIAVFEGRNKYQGMLGGITVEYLATDGSVYEVNCGSGFPDYLREEYWDDPSSIIGKYVEIESFGETRNAAGGYSLNCPIFKRIQGERE